MEKKNVPKIRFPGFTEPWEQRKLGEIGFAKSGVGFPDKEQGGKEGIPFFKVSDMNTEGNENELIVSNNYVTEEQIKRKKWSIIDDVPAIFFAKVGAAVLLNRKRLVRFPFLLDNNTMAYIFDKNVWNCDFGKALFETIDLTKLTQVGAIPSYNSSDVEDITICIPKLYEQAKIGEFFKKLDNLISLHQRKLENLKKQKKGLLQKMFPEKGKKVPEIRFPEFTDDWEQRKLGEISDKVTEKNINNTYNETFTNSAEYGIIPQRDFFEKDISNIKNLNGYYVVRNDDFVYNPRISNFAPVGPIKRNKLLKTGVMSPLYYVFRTRDIDRTYLEHYFDTTYWHMFMKLNGDSGARSDRFAIKDSVFVEMPIPFPKLEEQKKIGMFFEEFDNLITLHQRKLEHLQKQKKALLQQMFV